jgi:hypothetical protein
MKLNQLNITELVLPLNLHFLHLCRPIAELTSLQKSTFYAGITIFNHYIILYYIIFYYIYYIIL